MVQAQWDQDTPPYTSQALFPLLTGTPWKQYDLIGEGTHTVIMEKNRLQLFNAVQTSSKNPRRVSQSSLVSVAPERPAPLPAVFPHAERCTPGSVRTNERIIIH
ncbi:hypothetical protein P3T20_001221 [Paraburkholderia sp. GAS206C]|uniref:hypothetical protein n=1 Tax=unclassified Paraburkholderia TaxID=2615204 RepID=UPI003D218FA3